MTNKFIPPDGCSFAFSLSCPVFISWLSRRRDFRSHGGQLTSLSVSRCPWAIGTPPALILYTTLLLNWSPLICLSHSLLQWVTIRHTMAIGTLLFPLWKATASTSRHSAKPMERPKSTVFVWLRKVCCHVLVCVQPFFSHSGRHRQRWLKSTRKSCYFHWSHLHLYAERQA